MRAEKLCLLLGLCFVAGVAQAQETKTVKPTEKVDSAELFDKILDPDSVVTHGPNDWCSPHLVRPPSTQMTPTPQDPNAPVDPTTIRPPSTSSQLSQQPSVNTQPQRSMEFNTNSLASSGLGAARNVPSFMGDFFGGGGALPVCLPGAATADPLAGAMTKTFVRVDLINSSGFALLSDGGTIQYQSINPVQDPISGNPYPTTFWSDDPGFNFFPVTRTDAGAVQNAGVNPMTGNQQIRVVTSGTAVLDDIGADPMSTFYPFADPGLGLGDGDGRISPIVANDTSARAGESGADLLSVNEQTATFDLIQTQLPLSATAGRVKLSENSSPIPRDRLILNYSFFNNVALIPGGTDVNRITPGFEKTLFSENFSFEVRTPLAVTVDQDISQNAFATDQVEFGDVTVMLKSLLMKTQSSALSAGLGMSFPTSDDISFKLSNGVEALRIQHESVHFMPFVGGVYAPNSRFFSQGIMQVDVAANGDPVLMNLNPNGFITALGPQGLQQTGVWTDPTFLYVDANAGYWLYRDDNPYSRGVTGFAGMLEIHYNRSLQNFDQVTQEIPGTAAIGAKPFSIGDRNAYLEQLNLLIGGVTEFSSDSVVSFGYAFPVTSNSIFDGEFRVTFNHYFGRSSKRQYQRSNRPPGLL